MAGTMKLCQICAGAVPPLILPPSELVVIAADPDADDQVSGEADEQGVAIVLARPGLSEGRYGQSCPAARSVVGGRVEKVENRRPVARGVEPCPHALEKPGEAARVLLIREGPEHEPDIGRWRQLRKPRSARASSRRPYQARGWASSEDRLVIPRSRAARRR